MNFPVRLRIQNSATATTKSNREEDLLFMDPSAVEKEASLEVARELLIAISYSVPDTFLSSVPVETLNTGYQVVGTNSDRAEEFRSKLISISYLQSPDIGIIRCNGHHERLSCDHI